MSLEIGDYPSVPERLRALGIDYSTELLFLPRYFEGVDSSKMFHESTASTIRKLLAKEGIQSALVQPSGHALGTAKENNLAFLGPTIFVTALLYSQNPSAVVVALNVISNYATEFFLGRFGNKSARLDVVVEKPSGECKKLSYYGPLEGIKELSKSVERIFKG